MSTARSYFSNVAAQGFSRALSMAAGFAVFVLVTRLLGSEALGELAFVMAYVVLAGVLAELGTTAVLARDLASDREESLEVYFGNYLTIRAALAIGSIALSLPLASAIRPDLGELVVISSLAVPFVGTRALETVYQVCSRPHYTVIASLFLAVTQLAIAVILLVVLKVGLVGYLYGFVATQLAYFAVAMALAVKVLKPRFALHRRILGSILVVAAPVGVWSIFNAISTRADIFLLSYWRTAHEVGLYTAAFRLLDLATAVAATAAVPLVPVLTKKFGSDPRAMRHACARVIEMTVILSLPAALLLPPLAEPLMALIYGDAFRDSAPVLQLFSWLFVLLGAIYVGSAINLAAGNIQHAWWQAAIAAALNVGANTYLIPRFGIMGAAWASGISTAFMASVSQLYVIRNVGNLFIPSRWARILAAAVLTYATLLALAEKGVYLAVISGGCVYVAAILLLRLLPSEYLAIRKSSALTHR